MNEMNEIKSQLTFNDLPDELIEYIYSIVHRLKFQETLDKINEKYIRELFVRKYVKILIDAVIHRLESPAYVENNEINSS